MIGFWSSGEGSAKLEFPCHLGGKSMRRSANQPRGARGPIFLGLVSAGVLAFPGPTRTAEPRDDRSHPTWPLACRLASYGKYQDAAWDHLLSIGVHHVFMSVPKS